MTMTGSHVDAQPAERIIMTATTQIVILFVVMKEPLFH